MSESLLGRRQLKLLELNLMKNTSSPIIHVDNKCDNQKGKEKSFFDKIFNTPIPYTPTIYRKKNDNQPKKYYSVAVIHAKDLEINLYNEQEICHENVENIISKARYMKAFSTQKQGEEVFNGFRLSDEEIDYTQSINVVLLIEFSGTDDLLEAKNPYEFKNRLNPATAIVKGIRRLASIEGVSNQLHRLV